MHRHAIISLVRPDKDPIYERMLQNRIVFLGMPIDRTTANTACTCIRGLADKDSRVPLTLFINSPGGSVEDGLVILHEMDQCVIPIHTLCIGQAHAMAAILMAHGARGFRFAVKHARFSFTPIWRGGRGPITDVSGIQALCDSIVCKDTGLSLARVRDLSRRSLHFGAKEALRWGFIDRIVESIEEVSS